MSDRTEPTGPADDERRWIVEKVTTVEVGGEITDPQDGRPLTAVTIRIPAFVAAHLATALAALANIAEMTTRSSFDETELAQVLGRAAIAAERHTCS